MNWNAAFGFLTGFFAVATFITGIVFCIAHDQVIGFTLDGRDKAELCFFNSVIGLAVSGFLFYLL